jgi:CheY-like chemotaxis protein
MPAADDARSNQQRSRARPGHRTTPVPDPRVSAARLRVAVASPDPGLAARATHVLSGAGYEVAVVTDSPFDAMEAAFSRVVDVLVLDQDLARLSGSAVADLVASGESAVAIVLLRGRASPPTDGRPELDPAEAGFDAALAEAVARAPRRGA